MVKPRVPNRGRQKKISTGDISIPPGEQPKNTKTPPAKGLVKQGRDTYVTNPAGNLNPKPPKKVKRK